MQETGKLNGSPTNSKPWSVGRVRSLLASCIAIAMAVFHLWCGLMGQPNFIVFRTIHLSGMIVLTFLLKPLSGKKDKGFHVLDIVDFILVLATIAFQGYILFDLEGWVMRQGTPSPTDLAMGTLYILLVLEATRRSVGPLLVLIASVFLVQPLFAEKLFGVFRGPSVPYRMLIDFMVMRDEGIFGLPVAVSASQVILFIIFAELLIQSGAGQWFIDLAMSAFGHQRGGPAKAAVLASACMGTVSGSASANVVGTGSFTIPLMKKIGYDPVFAGAVEAVASTGGQLMPPIMGAAAFVMAQNLGVSYIQVCKWAVIPALLYFTALYFMIDLEAQRIGLAGLPKDSLPPVKALLKQGAPLLIPLVVIVWTLVLGYTPARAALLGIASLLVTTSLKKETRLTFRKLILGLQDGAKNTATVAIACAAAGIVVGSVNIVGLGLKIVHVVVDAVGGNLPILLVASMLISILLGMGLTTTSVYIMVATLTAPTLVKMGVMPAAAHLFCLYFGVISTVTPPVALASYAASGISGANPMATGFTGMKLAINAFLIPFVFVYGPELLLEGAPLAIIRAVIGALAGSYLLACSVLGYFLKPTSLLVRALLLASSLLLIDTGFITDVIGIALALVSFVIQKSARQKPATEIPGGITTSEDAVVND